MFVGRMRGSGDSECVGRNSSHVLLLKPKIRVVSLLLPRLHVQVVDGALERDDSVLAELVCRRRIVHRVKTCSSAGSTAPRASQGRRR